MPDYFTLAELDALPNMAEGRYTTARKEAAAAYIVAIIERAVRTSFVPRAKVDVLRGGSNTLVLTSPYIRSITLVTDSTGATVQADQYVADTGMLRMLSGDWECGAAGITVAYQAGYSDTPPADIKEAALQATRWRLIATASNTDLNARQTSITSDMGGTIQFSTAGPERPTGYPDVDAIIIGWRDELRVPTVA